MVEPALNTWTFHQRTFISTKNREIALLQTSLDVENLTFGEKLTGISYGFPTSMLVYPWLTNTSIVWRLWDHRGVGFWTMSSFWHHGKAGFPLFCLNLRISLDKSCLGFFGWVWTVLDSFGSFWTVLVLLYGILIYTY